MFRRASPLFAPILAAGLGACVAGPPAPGSGAQTTPPPKIAVLLPLTGPNASLAHDLQQAVQLALGTDGPQSDVRDTNGTPAGAAAAAQAAIAAGDTIIVGPLTAQETAAAASAVNGRIPILAFTSDRQQGHPGVWALGITPQQQVARLVQALTNTGKGRVAAALPNNIFGDALADGLARAATLAGDPPPVIKRYPTGNGPLLEAALREVSDYAGRRSAAASPPAATDSTDPAEQSRAATPAIQPMPPPPFDALLLAESGPALRAAASVLPTYDITMPDVQIVGPATWARETPGQTVLNGAWFAAPDPSARIEFEQAYAAKFASKPPGLADIAFDAASVAKDAASNLALITQPTGFSGADGLFVLTPDGQTFRALAIFEIGQGGSHLIIPPAATASPGS